MEIITEGHKYVLKSFEGTNPQTIQFIEKEGVKDDKGYFTGELITINDGTTNEEVIEMLINRLTFLNNKFPCRENALAITKLEESLFWLEKRTKNREKRGVEGKHEA